MRRVVVTGLGMVTPLGCGVETTWSRLLAARAGREQHRRFEVDDLACQIACQIPRGEGPTARSIPTSGWSRRSSARSTTSSSTPWRAATQALDDAGWEPKTDEDQIATGVLIGSGIGGIGGIYDASITLHERGPRRISPFFIPGRLINLAVGLCLDRARAQGPEPRGGHRLLDRRACDRRRRAADRARRCRRDGGRRHGIAGQPPVAGRLCRLPGAVDRASTTRRHRPRAPMTRIATASSWARAPAWWCWRSTSTPRRAARKIYAEVIGYGLSGDAYHITSPAEDGDGAYRCMAGGAEARRTSTPSEIDYINAHGTSTPLGDEIELQAVERLLGNAAGKRVDVLDQVGDRPPARRGRRGRGDLLDAGHPRPASRRRRSTSTIPSVETADRPRAAQRPSEATIDVALSNSFGFGGTNASLFFVAYRADRRGLPGFSP